MAKSVIPIPATKNRFSSKEISPDKKKRVAAYARVSTGMDEQFTSFDLQVEHYTDFIKKNPDWEFVEVYQDEGISGTHTKHREGFNRMIADAFAGKIDLIITKSVSRFARNTVDTLTTIRSLKDKGIEGDFEKENVWSLDSKGELLLTLLSSLAQEESRSLSENIRWSVNKKFEKGRFSLPYKCFLGYDRGPDGLPVVNRKEAEVVKEIFHRYLAGESPNCIASYLDSKGIPAPRGGKWSNTTIKSILQNEKYTGNAILQKKYTVDFLDKKKHINNGEVPKYYVRESHEAIISEELFDIVQMEIEKRRSFRRIPYSSDIFSGKIRCGECGHNYGAKIMHSNDKYRRIVYQCNRRFGLNALYCKTPNLTADQIKAVVVKALNKILVNKETVISNLETMRDSILVTDDLQKELQSLETEIIVTRNLLRKGISDGPNTDSDIHDAMQQKYDGMLHEREELRKEVATRRGKSADISRFIETLRASDNLVEEFSEDLFTSLIDHLTVYSKSCIGVSFRSGKEIKIKQASK